MGEKDTCKGVAQEARLEVDISCVAVARVESWLPRRKYSRPNIRASELGIESLENRQERLKQGSDPSQKELPM